MATRSILISVNIKGAEQTKEFISALEKARKKKGKEVKLQRMLRKVGKDQMEEFLAAVKK